MPLSAVLMVLLLAGCAATNSSYREGRSLVEQGRTDQALAKFRLAVQEDPRNAEYRSAWLQTLERAVLVELSRADRLAADTHSAEAQRGYLRVLELDASNERATAGLRQLEQDMRHRVWAQEAQAAWLRGDTVLARSRAAALMAENPRDPTALALLAQLDAKAAAASPEAVLSSAYAKPVTLEFRDVALKQVFDVLSRSSGLNFVFDKDVRAEQKTSIYLRNSSVQSAVYFMLMANQLDQQILDANTILIYPNTPAKQKEYQQTDIRTFYLTSGDAKTVAATLRAIVKSRDVVVDEKLNMLIVRDTPDALRLAEKLVALHDLPEPEVMLEVEILEVSRSRLQELGIKWPASLTLTPLSSSTGGVLTLNDLKYNINGRTLAATLAPVTLNAKQADTDTNILANPRIRARSHEKAKILIGSKVPNITTTVTSTGFVSESVNYLDVGLKLEVEPTVYLDDDVAIRIALEVSNILDQIKTNNGTVAYRIGTRTASTVLRLRDGENQVLAGLINDEDRRTADKVPALGEVPVLGRLFGSSSDDKQKSEIVLSITPRLVRNIQRPDAALAQFRAGTETSLRQMPSANAVAIQPVRAPLAIQRPAPAASALQAPSPAVRAVEASPSATTPDPAATSPEPPVSAAPAISDTAAGAVAAAPNSVQMNWRAPAGATIGTTFAVQLLVQPNSAIDSLPATFGYDASALELVRVEEGDLFRQSTASSSFDSKIPVLGQISVSSATGGQADAGREARFATFSFKALKATESARIELLSAVPGGVAGPAMHVSVPSPLSITIRP